MQVVPGEAYRLHPACIQFAQASQFQQADVLKRDRITRSAVVNHQVLVPAFGFEEADYLLLFLAGGHTKRKVNFAAEVITEIFQPALVQIACRGTLIRLGCNVQISLAEVMSHTEVEYSMPNSLHHACN